MQSPPLLLYRLNKKNISIYRICLTAYFNMSKALRRGIFLPQGSFYFIFIACR